MPFLVSKNRNIPSFPPHRIRLSSGLTRTDNNTFTEAELIDAGFVIVSPMPNDGSNYNWDGEKWIKIMD